MELVHLILEETPVKVCVDLRGGDLRMSQHFLDGAQVGTTLNQVGGKTVTERVWTDILPNAQQRRCASTW